MNDVFGVAVLECISKREDVCGCGMLVESSALLELVEKLTALGELQDKVHAALIIEVSIQA